MGRAPTVRPEARATAHTQLTDALERTTAPIPCRGQDAALWISDDRDDQATAALACEHCPALDACFQYVTTVREPCGVWAGMTREYRGEPA